MLGSVSSKSNNVCFSLLLCEGLGFFLAPHSPLNLTILLFLLLLLLLLLFERRVEEKYFLSFLVLSSLDNRLLTYFSLNSFNCSLNWSYSCSSSSNRSCTCLLWLNLVNTYFYAIYNKCYSFPSFSFSFSFSLESLSSLN